VVEVLVIPLEAAVVLVIPAKARVEKLVILFEAMVEEASSTI
jgi:hypothetical protein